MELGFYKVAMRPGKPLIFGRLGGIPVLGLPGNPVSAGVTSVIFLKPAMEKMLGIYDADAAQPTAVLGRALEKNDHRQDYLRAGLAQDDSGALVATPFEKQDSAMLSSLVAAGCLVVRAPHAPPAEAGARVEIVRF
jgi:molybdopterin molybdotransferase